MKKLLSLSMAALLLATASCNKLRIKGEGATISETRSVSSFNTVQSDGDVDVDIYASDENKVVVTGYHNLVPIFETNVSDSKLKLKFKNGYINVRNNNIHVAVYTTQLSNVKMNGSGNLNVHNGITSGSMDADVNGSGNITIGNNHFASMNLDVNGSGDIEAQSCTGDNVSARISGSGNIKITVGNTLDAHISGSGDIDYWGDPATVNSNISGSGKIHKH